MKLCRNCSAWIAVRVFNQISLRLNFRFGKEHQLLLLQNWCISAQIVFLQICINASLYEWPDHKGSVTIWLTIFCHSVKILFFKSMLLKNIVINIYSNSINNIIFKYYIDSCKFSKFVPLYKVDMKGTPRPRIKRKAKWLGFA